MTMLRPWTLPFALLGTVALLGQNTIAFQGFEGDGGCPDWGYSGGQVNSTMAEAGTSSARVGNIGGSTTLTLDPVDVSAYANVRINLSHAVQCGAGPGLDWGGGHEGAVVEVRYDGGAWTPVGRITGGNDHCYGWGSVGGNALAGCAVTMPNPLVVNVPNGTGSVAVRVFSTNLNACPNTTPNFYNRADEAFYIDNVRLTTSSPVVTPATGATTWKGTTSTDWFDCRNWDPPVVPGPGWDVTIDQTATQHCVIGATTGTPMDAQCANLTLATTGVLRRLTVQNGRTLTAAGDIDVQRTSVTTDSLVLLVNNGGLSCGDLTMTGMNATFRSNGAGNQVFIGGDLTINAQAKANVNNSTLHVGGDVSNLSSVSSFRRVNGWVVLNGTGAQTIGTSGFQDDYQRLRIAKPSGDVTLVSPIRMNPSGAVLQFVSGRLFTSDDHWLLFAAGTSATGASDASFVHGPVRKQGNTAFEFPVGKGSLWRPIATTGSTFGPATATNEYTAAYFHDDPTALFGEDLGPGLDHVSLCEYWRLDRTGTYTSTPEVRLTWNDPASCGVDLPIALRVAHWAGAQWLDRGNDDFIDNGGSGSVVADGPQSAFGYFTLASMDAMNPLPVEWLGFDAVAGAAHVDLFWATASERDNAGFHVERSADGTLFAPIAFVAGAGNNTGLRQYNSADPAPLPGWSYYRLRQVDHDGAEDISQVVPVHFTAMPSLLVDAERVMLRGASPGAHYRLFDAGGRALQEGLIDAGILDLPLNGLAPGIHLLQVVAMDGTTHTYRFPR